MDNSTFTQLQLTASHIEKLLDRRQNTTSFYLSVNVSISAVIGFLLKDTYLSSIWMVGSIFLLLSAGFIACWIWRSLLRQYEILLEWWYARLRELEGTVPELAKLITREYEELYLGIEEQRDNRHQLGMTRQEIMLNWVFTGLYAIFAVGIILSLLI